MHEDLQFPIQCSFQQIVYKNYSWEGDRLTSGDGSIFRRYDAFDRPGLISSLVHLVKHTTNTERARKAAMHKWIKRLGWLTVPPDRPLKFYSQSWRPSSPETYSQFWTAAQDLAYLWDLHGFILNRKLTDLRNLVRFEEVFPGCCLDFQSPVDRSILPKVDLMAPRESRARTAYAKDEHYLKNQPEPRTMYWLGTVEELEEEPMYYYQLAAFEYVAHHVEQHLKGVSLTSKGRTVARDSKQDHYKLKPRIVTITLLQAMYLQFYIMLNDRNKRICEACSKVFVPGRSDQKYCSTACKRTAKSRRQRKHQQLVLSLWEEGLSVCQIAERVNRSQARVESIIEKAERSKQDGKTGT